VDGILAEYLTTSGTPPFAVDYTIAEAAVSELVGDRASVLIFGAKIETGSTTFTEERTMLAGLRFVDGTWRIDSVDEAATSARTMPSIEPADPMESERDSAIDAARTIAATLTRNDEDDPQGSLARWLSVSTAPLADRLRALLLDDVKNRVETQADAVKSVSAASAVESGKATVLVAVSRTFTTNGTAQPPGHTPSWISLVRDTGGAWKAQDFRTVDTIRAN
jgi:hypothetical protein